MKLGQSSPKPKKEGFVFVSPIDDFRDRPMISLRIMGKPVAVIQLEDGTWLAREAACKHQGADLSSMPFTGSKVTCNRHGWQYDFLNGRCINRDSPPLRAHEVAVEDGSVFVSLFPKS